MRLSLLALSLSVFLWPVAAIDYAHAQSRLANGTCFTYDLNTYACTAWDVTGRSAGRYFGVLSATEYHPDNMNIAMIRVFEINDGTFILEEHLNNGWSQVPASFFLDQDDQNCIMVDWDNAFCFRPF